MRPTAGLLILASTAKQAALHRDGAQVGAQGRNFDVNACTRVASPAGGLDNPSLGCVSPLGLEGIAAFMMSETRVIRDGFSQSSS